jgi:predicted transcriptional regulator
MFSTPSSEQQIVQSLLDALHALPGLRAELRSLDGPTASRHYRPDAEINLEIAGRHITMRVEAKRELFPRDAREVLWRMDTWGGGGDGSPILRMIAADSLSPGAKELLKAEGVGYYDRGGSLYLPAPGAYIYIDKPAPKSLAKAIGSLFTGRRAQVIHALLLHPHEWLTGRSLADRAQVSTATVSQVMTELERLEFISPNEQGPHKVRQVREPGRLLDQWAEYLTPLKPPAFRRYFLPALRAEQLLDAVTRAFSAHEVPYAVSFEAAAQRYAPFLSSVSQVKCRAIGGIALESGLAALNARVVEEGANFSVLESKSVGDLLFREQFDTTWLSSPIQVYLDLLRSEGRAKELAQNLRRERIQF